MSLTFSSELRDIVKDYKKMIHILHIGLSLSIFIFIGLVVSGKITPQKIAYDLSIYLLPGIALILALASIFFFQKASKPHSLKNHLKECSENSAQVDKLPNSMRKKFELLGAEDRKIFAALQKIQATYLLGWALAESVTVVGIMGRITSLVDINTFYSMAAGSIILLIYMIPRKHSFELSSGLR